MRDAIFIIPIAMIFLSVLVSISAFHGGFHFAYVRFLTKFKHFNDYIVKYGSTDELHQLNCFLQDIQVEKNKVTFVDWLKFGFLGRGR